MSVKLFEGDCLDVLKTMADNSVDSVVTDPPYGISFMGTKWDYDVPSVEIWREVLRVLKPGGHLLSFSGTRTYHRMVVAIEDAGFEIRDQVGWLYGSGFPKSLDVAKSIDKAARGVPQGGADPTSVNHGKYKGGCSEDNPTGRGFGAGPGSFMSEAGNKDKRELVPESEQWQGWGTALKPAWEPICVARKPLIGTVVANVLAYGTGAINVDACRVETDDNRDRPRGSFPHSDDAWGSGTLTRTEGSPLGRWPANIIHDGSDEVLEAFASFGEKNGGHHPNKRGKGAISTSGHVGQEDLQESFSDTGTAARFFYCAKASKAERAGSSHKTIKPVALMRYLTKLVTPPGGTILDPFAGSGSTGKAAIDEGFDAILIEKEAEYCNEIRDRLFFFLDQDTN